MNYWKVKVLRKNELALFVDFPSPTLQVFPCFCHNKSSEVKKHPKGCVLYTCGKRYVAHVFVLCDRVHHLCLMPHNNLKTKEFLWEVKIEETLPEAQRTPGIDSLT